MQNDDQDLRYPIGQQEDQNFYNKEYDETVKIELLHEIKILPANLEYAIQNLDAHQLDTPYRPAGWTVKQLIHHIADSHINAYVRLKLGLTENNPTIKLYEEAAWAELPDTKNLPINISLTLLHALHARWYQLMYDMNAIQWQRTIFHPGKNKSITLWNLLKMYAWHSKHHTAHITHLRERMKWK